MQEKKLIKSTIILIVLMVSTSLISFISQIIIAKYFGASKLLDAFVVVSVLPLFIYGLTSNSLTTGLIYIFTTHKILNNKRKFDKIASNAINISALIMLIISVLSFLLSNIIARILAPGFDGEQLLLTSELIKIISIAIFFWGLSSTFTGLLNLKNQFITPGLLRALQTLFIIICIIILYKQYSIYSLAIGLVIGTIIAFILQMINLIKIGFKYQFSFFIKDSLFFELFKISWPLWVITVLYYINRIINNMFASTIESGSISILNYAFIISSLPYIIISTAISTTTFPYLTKQNINNKIKRFSDILYHSISVALLILVPITIMGIIFSEQIIRIILQRGEFDYVAVVKTASAFSYYLIGISAMAVYTLIINALISMGEIKKSMWLTTALVLLNIFFNALLIKFETSGLAAALSISYITTCFISLIIIKNKVKLNITKLTKVCIKILIAILPSTVMLLLFKNTTNFGILILIIIMNMILYLCMISLLKINKVLWFKYYKE